MAACLCIANSCPYPTRYLCGWQTWGRRSNLIAPVNWEGARTHSPRPNATHGRRNLGSHHPAPWHHWAREQVRSGD